MIRIMPWLHSQYGTWKEFALIYIYSRSARDSCVWLVEKKTQAIVCRVLYHPEVTIVCIYI